MREAAIRVTFEPYTFEEWLRKILTRDEKAVRKDSTVKIDGNAMEKKEEGK